MLNSILNAFGAKWAPSTQVAQPAAKTNNKADFANALTEANNKSAPAKADDAKLFAQIEPGSAKQTTAVEEFLKYQNLSMAEKLRASFLAQKGLTEEDVAAMSPEERLKIEEEIKEAIKRKLDPSQA